MYAVRKLRFTKNCQDFCQTLIWLTYDNYLGGTNIYSHKISLSKLASIFCSDFCSRLIGNSGVSVWGYDISITANFDIFTRVWNWLCALHSNVLSLGGNARFAIDIDTNIANHDCFCHISLIISNGAVYFKNFTCTFFIRTNGGNT